ncbi:hypothetical protein [Mucilaginibacter pedocola]|uniref:RNA polymerase sigma factor 70 region 4 type 2 domain-containing protein n=1 Tax=Mucilaginibacter pedocola TaxID=1792845 RepID=A0A1S9P896_9SPHI|nr:hypothetical protein [Mucilaginibacter pedocola]OOQ57159.1 hypothetical protein BC343_16700 [Mucilaginibacter pedocola]
MKNKLLTELFNSREFNRCIKKMRPEWLHDDLRAEVALILCEMPEEKIMALHQQGVLRFYAVRIILNLAQSSTSPFFKKFRASWVELENIIEPAYIEYDKEKEAMLTQAITEIDNLYWYDKELLKLYLKLGSYRAMEQETGIPFESIYKTVQQACKAIRTKVTS